MPENKKPERVRGRPKTVPGLLFIFRGRDPRLFGGVPRKILLIAKWLNERGLFLPMLLTSHGTDFSKAFAALDLPVHSAAMTGPGAVRRTGRAVEALMARHNIALIQTHTFWESIAGRSLRKRHPGLRHLFRVHTHVEGSTIPWWRKKFYHLLDWWTSRHVDSFCVLSEVIKQELTAKSHVDAARIRVVRNGIPALGEPDAATCGDSPLAPHFAVVGDIQKRKRQDLAVLALHDLRTRGVRAQLRLIGLEREGFGDEVREIARRLGVLEEVRFTGYTDDVYGALKGCEVVALASDFEGIPTSIIEAMSVKKIGIATSVGGTAELIDDRRNGFIIEPGNATMLADILHELFTTPAHRWAALRHAGFETWQNRFSLEVMMRGLLREYVALDVISKEQAEGALADGRGE